MEDHHGDEHYNTPCTSHTLTGKKFLGDLTTITQMGDAPLIKGGGAVSPILFLRWTALQKNLAITAQHQLERLHPHCRPLHQQLQQEREQPARYRVFPSKPPSRHP